MISIRASLLLLFLFLTIAAPVSAERPEPEIHGEFEGEPMYTVLPPDAIPAIREPVFLNGEEATAQMRENEPVMGLLIDGEARAYSLWQLDSHEIVNDAIGEKSFAVTW